MTAGNLGLGCINFMGSSFMNSKIFQLTNTWNSTLGFFATQPFFSAGSGYGFGFNFFEANSGLFGNNIWSSYYNALCANQTEKNPESTKSENTNPENTKLENTNPTGTIPAGTNPFTQNEKNNILMKLTEIDTEIENLKLEARHALDNVKDASSENIALGKAANEMQRLLDSENPSKEDLQVCLNKIKTHQGLTNQKLVVAEHELEQDIIPGLNRIDNSVDVLKTQVEALDVVTQTPAANTGSTTPTTTTTTTTTTTDASTTQSPAEDPALAQAKTRAQELGIKLDGTESLQQIQDKIRAKESELLAGYQAVNDDSAYRIAGKVYAIKNNKEYDALTAQDWVAIKELQAKLNIPTMTGQQFKAQHPKYKGRIYDEYSILSVGQKVNLNLLGDDYREAALKLLAKAPASATSAEPATTIVKSPKVKNSRFEESISTRPEPIISTKVSEGFIGSDPSSIIKITLGIIPEAI